MLPESDHEGTKINVWDIEDSAEMSCPARLVFRDFCLRCTVALDKHPTPDLALLLPFLSFPLADKEPEQENLTTLPVQVTSIALRHT